MAQVPSLKLPPKGSFSSRYKSTSREPTKRSPKSSDTTSRQTSLDFLNFSEMFEYAQIALEKTSEVQNDINKLFNLWEGQKDQKDSEYLNFVNTLLEENNMKPLGSTPTFKKILKTIVKLLAELKVLRQSLAEQSDPEGAINEYKKHIKNLEKQLGSIKSQFNEYHEISLKQLETNKKTLKDIQDLLEAENEEDILPKIESLQNIAKLVPSLEIFVQEICKELVPEIVKDEDYESFALGLKEVFPKIKVFKAAIEELTDFKLKVYKSLKINLLNSEQEALEKIECIKYFEKLFEVDPSEDIFDIMEKLFLYYRDSKQIIERLKSKLNLSPNLSIFQLTQRINSLLL